MRSVSIFLAVLMLLMLIPSGCNKVETIVITTPIVSPSRSDSELDLEIVFKQLIEQEKEVGYEPFMVRISSGATLEEMYPGVTELELKQFISYLTPQGGDGSETVLIEASDLETADKMEEILRKRAFSKQEDLQMRIERLGVFLLFLAYPKNFELPDGILTTAAMEQR